MAWGLDASRNVPGFIEIHGPEAQWLLRELREEQRHHPRFRSCWPDFGKFVSASPLDTPSFDACRIHRRPSRRGLPPREPLVDLRDLAGPDADETSTWFEVRLVDGAMRSLSGLDVKVLHDGDTARRTTDGSGRARITDVTGRAASLWIPATETLRSALEEAWRSPNDEPFVSSSDEVEVVYFRDGSIGPIALRAERPKVVSIQPFVVLGRVGGMLFDTNKSFLLPVSLAAVEETKALYDRCAPCHLLVVGHTDATGQTEENEVLSLQRAERVVEYLRDDVEAWLRCYGSDQTPETRWGAAEDRAMLEALPDYGSRPPGTDPLRWFQSTRGLTVDGVAGPQTRRKLIAEYMARDGVAIPDHISIVAHGCGESFPLAGTGAPNDVAPQDGAGCPLDRRVEVFFFASSLGVQPLPPARTSKVGSLEYPSWRHRARETHEKIIGPRALELVLHDPDGKPIPRAKYKVHLPAGSVLEGELDEHGCARLERLPAGLCRVDFPDFNQGAVLETTSPLM